LHELSEQIKRHLITKENSVKIFLANRKEAFFGPGQGDHAFTCFPFLTRPYTLKLKRMDNLPAFLPEGWTIPDRSFNIRPVLE
jgi:hypothetical protein